MLSFLHPGNSKQPDFKNLPHGPGALMQPLATSDSIHVYHYEIHIDTINFPAKSIQGKTLVRIISQLNGVNNITLALLKFQTDSVYSASQLLPYSYNDTLLRITPPSLLNTGDTLTLTVYYHGSPAQDPTWGGFYFNGAFAFNMGVGFGADPHNFGRAWFPCIDEFTDRATYDFFITAPSSSKAFCNGLLSDSVINAGGTTTWHWALGNTIPSYLACMAVAPYYTMKSYCSGIPVEWAVLPADTAKTAGTFLNLASALAAFTAAYGPYRWEKIGFTAVPFGMGAMEHATSIHIGSTYIDGTTAYETLWAHELSHMWWGDLVTCSNEGDMWLNEGFATYSEKLFTENLYGTTAYMDAVRSNHRMVLQFAHVKDGSYLPLSNVPHAYTYGTTVYNKGADIIHTLRNYMGDSAFFKGCKNYMAQLAFANAASADLRDQLAASSGMNLNRFFDDWVFSPGFPHFSIDSVTAIPSGPLFNVGVFTRQRAKGTNHCYSMPVECTFTDGLNDTSVTLPVDTFLNFFQVTLPFNPVWVSLDRNEKISDAVSDYEMKIDTAGTMPFPETNVSLNIKNPGTAPSPVRIEHHWVAPDGFKNINPGIRLSDYHYWKADGIFSNGFLSSATFAFDGSYSSITGYIDNTLFPPGGKEDSLVILYRKGSADEWKPVSSFSLNKAGSGIDKIGSITVDTLKKGEYALGYYDYTAGMKETDVPSGTIEVFPNPSAGNFFISFVAENDKAASLKIYDAAGNLVYIENAACYKGTNTRKMNIQVPGIYFICIESYKTPVKTARIVVCR